MVDNAQTDHTAEIIDRECLRVPAHAKGTHTGGRLPLEGGWRLWRGSVGNSDDGKTVVDAEGLTAQAAERTEIHFCAVVAPKMGERGGAPRRKNPSDNIAGVVDAERLTNGSRWVEVGQGPGRVPLHCVEHAACIELPADRDPIGVDRLRQAGVAPEVGESLHASIGVPDKGSRGEKIVSERESDDRARLIDVVCQRRGKAGECPQNSELVIGAPAYGRPAVVSLVPTRGNTGVVDCARLTGERVPRNGERLRSISISGVRSKRSETKQFERR